LDVWARQVGRLQLFAKPVPSPSPYAFLAERGSPAPCPESPGLSIGFMLGRHSASDHASVPTFPEKQEIERGKQRIRMRWICTRRLRCSDPNTCEIPMFLTLERFLAGRRLLAGWRGRLTGGRLAGGRLAGPLLSLVISKVKNPPYTPYLYSHIHFTWTTLPHIGVWGLGFGVWGLGFGVKGLGFRV
jgi:hypothetical protein